MLQKKEEKKQEEKPFIIIIISRLTFHNWSKEIQPYSASENCSS